jgi:hypothetical protein
VVYYAGHGIEVGGTNYLIPVDAKLARDYDVQDEAVALDRIIWALQSVKRLRLILLDACRDNPFVAKLQRSVGIRAAAKGGLAKIDDVSADTLVAYAAKAGSVSYDGDGADSPFASALLKHVAEPGLDIRIALGRVRDEVLKMTGGRQEPFIYGSLGGATIPLVPLPPRKIEPAPAPPAVAAREPAARPNAAAAPAKVEPAKAPPSNSQATLDRTDPALACGRDEQRLARLRSDPAPEEIARFSRELSCERLRLQVQRLFESVATGPAAGAAPSAAPLGATAPADATRLEPGSETGVRSQANSRAALDDPAVACNRDELRLARLRSDPVPDEIARFRHELACDRLRAQVQRLFESAAPADATRPGPGSEAGVRSQANSQAALDRDDPALACSRDELRLARLRSDPVPDEVARFRRELSCERLRAQVQRLFESVATGPLAAATPLGAAAPVNATRRLGPSFKTELRTQAQAQPNQGDNSCAGDADRLARLRADPTIEAIAQFERELGCELSGLSFADCGRASANRGAPPG